MREESQTLFPVEPLRDEVTIYHDETKEAFGKNIWGHGLLFVPERTKASLLSDLQAARDKTNYQGKLHFADISESVYIPKYNCTKKWIEIGVEYLKRKKGCKLGVIFFDKASINIDFYSGNKKEKILKSVETVLRMVLKGSVHYLYNNDWQEKINEIITDAENWHRNLDESRILDRLIPEVRDYVEILPGAKIKGVFSNHQDKRCEDTNSAHLLQLTDLLMGSVIQSYFRELKIGTKKEILVRPVREMLDKRRRGRRFQKSSHYMSFTVSSVKVTGDNWNFEPLNLQKVIINDDGQLSLTFNNKEYYETD